MPATNRQDPSRTASQPWPGPNLSSVPADLHVARSWHPPLLYLAAILLFWLVAGAALTLDMSVVHFWKTHNTPAFVMDLLESAETFGNGAGVLLLLVSVLVLRAVPAPTVLRLALASFGGGLTADLFKLVVARTRPRDLTIQQGVLETFGDWFSPLAMPTAMHSFPSAHVATAVGLACALSYYYPRGRYVFAGLVLLVALQRVQTGAHFVSDTLAGAAIGLGPALVLFGIGPIARWFDRFESPGRYLGGTHRSVPIPHLN